MSSKTIYIDKTSAIPLYGVDFLGIIDRGTNIIELKPLNLCNLKCRYCFVSAGDYDNNFIVNSDYLVEKVKKIVDFKDSHNIEIHIAPYGETLLYPELDNLLKKLWTIEGIEVISMQSNGLLLSKQIIKNLEENRLSRINISLNTLNQEKAGYLCDCKNYDLKNLIKNIHILLNTSIDVLLAPVWFPGENDKDIEDIIKFVIDLRNQGFSEKKIQLGIQKYLIYKTGRKLKKIRPKSWDYFYKQLSKLERQYNLKLKLGPRDFGIQKIKTMVRLNYRKGDLIRLEIVSKGRWHNECIGKITKDIGIKILLNKPFQYSENLIGKEIKAKIIKANYKDNIMTAIFPY